MAIAGIIYRLPYATLVSFTVTPQAGGNFPAGTYDFYAIVSDSQATAAAPVESPPISHTGVVLNGSQGVKIDIVWDGTHTNGLYCQVWFIKGSLRTTLRPDGNWYFLICPNITRTQLTYNYYNNYFICMSSFTFFPFGLDNQKGAGVIEINGNIGTKTIKQILDDMETAGIANTDIAIYNRTNSFFGCWSIRSATGAAGTLNISGFTLWFYSVCFKVTGLNIVSYKGIYTTHLMAYKASGATVQMSLYYCNLVGATLSDGANNMGGYFGNIQIGYNANSRLFGCIIFQNYVNLNYPEQFNNCIGYASYCLSTLNSTEYTNPFSLYGYLKIYNLNCNMYWREWKVFQPSIGVAYTLCVLCSSDNRVIHAIQKLCDCWFILYQSTTDLTEVSRSDYPLIIYWNVLSTFANNYQMLHIEHSVNIMVQDINGDIIEGATINIYDKTNTLIATEITDENGEIDEIILICKKIQYIEGSPNNCYSSEGEYHTVDRQYPFTLEIIKTGYNTYISIYEALEDKIDNVLTLQYESVKIASVVITNSQGIADGSIQVNAESGNVPYQYSMNGMDYQDDNIFKNLPGCSYNIYVKDSKGTSDSILGIKVTQIAENLITANIVLSELSGEISDNELEGDLIEISESADLDVTELSGEITQIQLNGSIEN